MKPRFFTLLLALVMAAGLTVVAPQSATASDGTTWRSYNGSTWTNPAGWYCGKTVNGTLLSTQACVIKSGNVRKVALIVRNRASISVSVSGADVHHFMRSASGSETMKTSVCKASAIAAKSVSVCYAGTSTTLRSSAWGSVDGRDFTYSWQSPWI